MKGRSYRPTYDPLNFHVGTRRPSSSSSPPRRGSRLYNSKGAHHEPGPTKKEDKMARAREAKAKEAEKGKKGADVETEDEEMADDQEQEPERHWAKDCMAVDGMIVDTTTPNHHASSTSATPARDGIATEYCQRDCHSTATDAMVVDARAVNDKVASLAQQPALRETFAKEIRKGNTSTAMRSQPSSKPPSLTCAEPRIDLRSSSRPSAATSPAPANAPAAHPRMVSSMHGFSTLDPNPATSPSST